jgi:Tol biopolymer transport system component
MIPPPLVEGMCLGRYRLVRLLGRGGMGEVWEGRDERLERQVAVKVLPLALAADPAAEKRFRREAVALARLLHPNIVTLFDVGSADPGVGVEYPFIVMELVAGRSLSERLAEGRLPVGECVELFEQIARALAAAHATGVVHRDLKPANVMIGSDGQVKVLDFGLARLLEPAGDVREDSLTGTGVVLGSYHYMAPEQARGEHATPAADVFSLGVMLYEALTGLKPFEGSTPVSVLHGIVAGRHAPIEEVAAGLPDTVTAVVRRCMEADPRRRYPDGRALAADLRAARGALPAETMLPTERVSLRPALAVRRLRRARWVRAATVALVGVAVGALAAFLLARSGWELLRPDPGRWKARVVLQTAGQLREPAWHPDGRSLLVERHIGDVAEILSQGLDGSEPRVLARREGGEFLARPSLSGDGRLLAYAVLSETEHRVEVIPATGGPPLAVIPAADRPVWFGSSRVVFSRATGELSRLWSFEVATGAVEPVELRPADTSWWYAQPRPGGGFAALGGQDDVHGRIVVVPAGGRDGQEWTGESRVEGFSWAPSGRSLVAIVERRLVRVTPDGAQPLTPPGDNLVEPAFSPDGDRLALARNQAQTDLLAVDPATGTADCLLCSVTGAGWGSVAPDGAVAYRRMVGPLRSVFLRDPGGQERRLIPVEENGSCPAFSPDGRRVVYLVRGGDGRERLQVVARDGGQPVVLAEDVASSEFPAWSPDGRFVAYAAGDPPRVWVVSGGGGTPRLITPERGDYPSWSRDGNSVGYVVWTDDEDPAQGAWIVAAGGGAPRKVSPAPTPLIWAADGRAVFQLQRDGFALRVHRAAPGEWRWSAGPRVALGHPAEPHAEHLPITVDLASGRLVVIRRVNTGELVVFEGVQRERW